MSDKKPGPLYRESPGQLCPVCGKKSYSRCGIHPQCAVKQADASSKALLAAQQSKHVASSVE
jgi:hypothetical protein